MVLTKVGIENYRCGNLNPYSPGDCMLEPEDQATHSEIYHEPTPFLKLPLQYVRCKVADCPTSQLICSGNPDSPKAVFVHK
jgi:hypothetical protein